jgi:hypothetical protein
MATLILTAVGTAIGGPIGGAIGAIAGQVIDQAIFAPAARQGPRLTDLTVQTSTYGAAIPHIFGRTRVAGTVIWSTDLIETKKSQSNGKGRAATETYSYSASFAVLLSARRIIRVERIWADGKLLRGSAGDLKVGLAALRVYKGDADQIVDPLIASAEGADAPAYRGLAYAVFEELQLGDFGNRIPSLTFEVVADDAAVGAGALIAELVAPDAMADTGPLLSGFAATGTTVRAVAETLGTAFPILCRDENGVRLRFAPTYVGALEVRDLGAHSGRETQNRTAFDIDPLDTVPASMTLAYLDPARDYQPGLQRARREGPGQQAGRVDLPAVLGAGQARGIVEAALSRKIAARSRARVALPWRAMTLRPGDAVRLADADWRIAASRFERMACELDLVRVSNVVIDATAEPGRNVAQPDAPHGATLIEVIDLPPLSDVAATHPAVTVFASGASAGWRRAALLSSIDGGVTFDTAGSTALPAIIGATVTPLDAGPAELIDRVSSVEVELAGAWMALADADQSALLAGGNRAMIGNELIQFGRATRLSPTRWRLSELWRGRRGTEDAIEIHPPASRFVLIDNDSAVLLPVERAVPGVRVMAAGIGDSEPYPSATSPTASRAVLPLSPVHLRASLLPSGDTELRWTRRSREGWTWRDTVDSPLSEEREAYRVTKTGHGETTSADVATPVFVYSADMQAGDAAGGATTVSFAVAQIGAAGLSPPATLDLSLT